MPDTPGSGPAADRIVRFFRNESPDHSGRYLREILGWDDEPLEYTHDFIQWLFPMRTPSPVNPDAPTVDDATIAAFASDLALQPALAAALYRMMAFYGFAVESEHGKLSVVRAENWPARSANWLTPGNHNMLRITRILTSLRLLGLDHYAEAFFTALEDLHSSDEGSSIGERTFGFWKFAACPRNDERSRDRATRRRSDAG